MICWRRDQASASFIDLLAAVCDGLDEPGESTIAPRIVVGIAVATIRAHIQLRRQAGTYQD
jgi:hypothetical protein